VELVTTADAADPHVPATPEWTVTDTFGHVAMEPSRYHELAKGGGEWPRRAADLPAFNARQIAELPTRDRQQLGEKLLSDLDALLDTVAGFDDVAPMMFFDGDQRIRADVALGTLIGEFVVHGYDIARVLHTTWPIDAALAPLIIRGQHQVMPGWVNTTNSDGHTATYEFRLRGQEAYVYEFTGGRLTVNPAQPRPIGVHISAEPVTALLLSYGRVNPTRAALTGRILAWGRKPWLAPRFSQRFLPA
jgi:uncharacterized protein (TIGR03083 family)